MPDLHNRSERGCEHRRSLKAKSTEFTRPSKPDDVLPDEDMNYDNSISSTDEEVSSSIAGVEVPPMGSLLASVADTQARLKSLMLLSDTDRKLEELKKEFDTADYQKEVNESIDMIDSNEDFDSGDF